MLLPETSGDYNLINFQGEAQGAVSISLDCSRAKEVTLPAVGARH